MACINAEAMGQFTPAIFRQDLGADHKMLRKPLSYDVSACTH